MTKFLLIVLFLMGGAAVDAETSAKNDRATPAQFDVSLKFYKWRLAQGDSLAELESILTRIMTKYAATGIRLNVVDRELSSIRGLRTAIAKKPSGGTAVKKAPGGGKGALE